MVVLPLVLVTEFVVRGLDRLEDVARGPALDAHLPGRRSCGRRDAADVRESVLEPLGRVVERDGAGDRGVAPVADADDGQTA